MAMRLLSASERLSELRGPKILFAGRPGVGKTSRLRTLSATALQTTLLVDLEAGDLPVADVEVASLRPGPWPEIRDFGVAISGPDPGRAQGAYSQAHYDSVIANPALAELPKFGIVFVDSYTELSRRCRTWAEQQPEAFNQYGKKDLRAVYGLVARELIGWTSQIQRALSRTVILVAILEERVDDYGVKSWGIQIEGQRTARELPAILDEILIMERVKFSDGVTRRAFICDPNHQQFGRLIKDRAGVLDPVEKPDLDQLLRKLARRQQHEGKE